MENCIKPKIVKVSPKIGTPFYQKVPCQVCPLCLNSKRMNWLMRIEQEFATNQYPSYFLTLTYDEKHVPRKKGVKTLYKRHPQLFFKRLRKAGYYAKYVLVGEYGSQTSRPHYHAIIWTNATDSGLLAAWHYGSLHIKSVGRASILYTLKYIVQPKDGDNLEKQKTFALFSKSLGLGYLTTARYYYHNPVDSETNGGEKFHAVIDGREIPLPKYYRDKIFTKYQRRKQADIVSTLAIKNRRKALRELIKQRHPNPKAALKERALNAAKSIKTKVKFNQTL